MANRHRGEVGASLDGKDYVLCLTLGALAEMESAFGHKDLVELAERFSKGRIAADEAVTILQLGLKGGGHEMARSDISALRFEGGATGAVKLVSELLAATFGADEPEPPDSFGAQAPKRGDAPRP